MTREEKILRSLWRIERLLTLDVRHVGRADVIADLEQERHDDEWEEE